MDTAEGTVVGTAVAMVAAELAWEAVACMVAVVRVLAVMRVVQVEVEVMVALLSASAVEEVAQAMEL